MGSGIYTALSGALATNRRLDVVSHNLANVNTVGFKGEQMVFKEVLAKQGWGRQDKSMVAPNGIAVTHTQGQLTPTENPLDLAIEGAGFFTVKTPKGERLTRNGAFKIAGDGTVVNNQGHPLLNRDNEPLRVPIPMGDITIAQDGTVRQGEEVLGRLKLQKAKKPELLNKQEGQYFRPIRRAGLYLPEETQDLVHVKSGYVEQANVNPVSGMTELITVQRHFEMTTKAIQVYEQINSLAAKELGRPA